MCSTRRWGPCTIGRSVGLHPFLLKTLCQTGARVSEFVNLKAEDVFFDKQMLLMAKAKGGKNPYVPILPERAQELGTYLGKRTMVFLYKHAASPHPGHASKGPKWGFLYSPLMRRTA